MRTLTLLFISISLTYYAWAEDWPSWRGPRLDGTSTETAFPTTWSESDNIAWRVSLPGKGHSSPAIVGERIFVSSCNEETNERLLFCLHRADGRILWQKTVLTAPLEPIHRLNSRASSTPATDGKYVWVTFLDKPKYIAVCFDMEGREIWRVSPGEFHSRHGFCSPPIPYKDMIVLNGDQDAKAYIVALDKATGQERWRADRPNRTRSYTPPLIVQTAGRNELVLSGSKCVAGYDPDTGKQLWIVDGPTEQFVASLVHHDGVYFVTGGYPTYHLMGIRSGGNGNISKTHILWHHEKDASYVPSPAVANGLFFVVTDNGLVMCLDPKTGQRYWKERLGKHHSASPVTAGGLLYFPDEFGSTHVLRASSTFEVVSRNKLPDEFYASPALSDGQIFLRGLKSLWCVGKRPK